LPKFKSTKIYYTAVSKNYTGTSNRSVIPQSPSSGDSMSCSLCQVGVTKVYSHSLT